MDTAVGIFKEATSGDIQGVDDLGKLAEKNVGLFKDCMNIANHEAMFQGECFPTLEELQSIFTDLNDEKYPHAWRGAVLLFGLGLALMVITDLFALLTACCRTCICCSVFTICGSLQTFAGIFFSLGLIAYPAGWGSKIVKGACNDASEPFVLGDNCDIGVAFWVAVAGTVCPFWPHPWPFSRTNPPALASANKPKMMGNTAYVSSNYNYISAQKRKTYRQIYSKPSAFFRL